MKIKYSLKKLYPGIYLCKIEDMYDLAMTFCRVQEFYESPFKQIRGKRFTLIELMALYSKKNEGSFTYPMDWGGFNIPGPVIASLYDYKIEDYNIYDSIILEIHNKIVTETESNQYYLIGSNTDVCTIEHECCHALFFLDKNYRENALKILKKLHRSLRKKAEDVLFELGYDKSVMDDEIQAYLTTEFNTLKAKKKLNTKEQKNYNSVVKELKENFKSYREKIKL
jgi:hypothetical protein